jgi:hypothetical protein
MATCPKHDREESDPLFSERECRCSKRRRLYVNQHRALMRAAWEHMIAELERIEASPA